MTFYLGLQIFLDTGLHSAHGPPYPVFRLPSGEDLDETDEPLTVFWDLLFLQVSLPLLLRAEEEKGPRDNRCPPAMGQTCQRACVRSPPAFL